MLTAGARTQAARKTCQALARGLSHTPQRQLVPAVEILLLPKYGAGVARRAPTAITQAAMTYVPYPCRRPRSCCLLILASTCTGIHRQSSSKQQYKQQQSQARESALAFWNAALVASSVTILSSDAQNASASSSSKKDSDGEDLVEQLKKKLQLFMDESLVSLQQLLPEQFGNEDLQKQFNAFLASGKGGQISWGLMMGACSGFAMKKISKVGAVALGSLFVLMQCASYAGYIDVDYKKLERDVMTMLDINKVPTQ